MWNIKIEEIYQQGKYPVAWNNSSRLLTESIMKALGDNMDEWRLY